MTDITTVLLAIDKASWYLECAALVVFLNYAVQDKKTNSSLIAMAIMVFLGLLMRWYAPQLLALKTADNLPLILFVWYVGFVAVHALGMWLLFVVHNAFTIRYSIIAKILLNGYLVLAMAQLLRYSERLLLGFDSTMLKPLYQALVPAVNIAMAISACGFALLMGISRYRIKRGKRGLAWVL